MKRNNEKDNKFPKNAFAFYVKLYFKQKGSSESKYQSNIVQVIKSWLSLTDAEKQELNIKYKESELKFKQQCFEQLKNAELFMKAKNCRVKSLDLSSNHTVHQDSHIKGINQQTELEIVSNEDQPLGSNECDQVNDIESDNDCEQPNILREECNETKEEPINVNEHFSRTLLVEPLPPTLRTGKDLFHMLNPGGTSNISWMALQKVERNQYSRAVVLLKKDYITKYKQYLESLTPKELFDYYNKIL